VAEAIASSYLKRVRVAAVTLVCLMLLCAAQVGSVIGFKSWIVPSLLNTMFDTTTIHTTGVADKTLTLFGNALRTGLLIDAGNMEEQPARAPLAVMQAFFVDVSEQAPALAHSGCCLFALLFGDVNAKTFEQAFVLATAAKLAAHRIARDMRPAWRVWWPHDVARPGNAVYLFSNDIDCTDALFPPCVILNGDATTINAIQFPIGDIVARNVLIVKGSLWNETWQVDEQQTWAGGSQCTVVYLEHGVLAHSSLLTMEAIDGLLLLKLTSGAVHLVLLQMKHSAYEADNTQRFPELVTATVNAQRLLTGVIANAEHPLSIAGIKSMQQVTLCFVLLRDVPAKFNDVTAVKMTFANHWTYGIATKPASGATKLRATMPTFNVVALTSDSVRGHFGASHTLTPFLELSAGAGPRTI
jgi:hypothetical protein